MQFHYPTSKPVELQDARLMRPRDIEDSRWDNKSICMREIAQLRAESGLRLALSIPVIVVTADLKKEFAMSKRDLFIFATPIAIFATGAFVLTQPVEPINLAVAIMLPAAVMIAIFTYAISTCISDFESTERP
jgi:hypothetical protein